MKKRTMALIAGMVLVAASAGFSQAAGLDKKADTNAVFSSNAASGVPDILGSFDNASAYQAISKQEMRGIQGEATYLVVISRSRGVLSIDRISILPLFRTVIQYRYVD